MDVTPTAHCGSTQSRKMSHPWGERIRIHAMANKAFLHLSSSSHSPIAGKGDTRVVDSHFGSAVQPPDHTCRGAHR